MKSSSPAGAPVVAITGAGRGIGAAAASRFAREGWRVAVLDRDAATVEETAKALGAACIWSGVADVADFSSLAAAAVTIAARVPRLDVLVNNAGILNVGPFEAASAAADEQQIRVNFLGTVNSIHAFFESLRATPGARIVNMASASSIYGTPDFAVYSATKFAIRGLTEALEIEFKRHDIRVSDICPPFVGGKMLSEQAYTSKGIANMGGIKMDAETRRGLDLARSHGRAATRSLHLANGSAHASRALGDPRAHATNYCSIARLLGNEPPRSAIDKSHYRLTSDTSSSGETHRAAAIILHSYR